MNGNGSQDIYSRVFGPEGGGEMTGSEGVMLQSPEKDKLGRRVMREIEQSEGRYSAWNGPGKEYDRYYNGNQWDDIDRMAMEQQKRPVLTFNDIKPIVDAVSGMERLNRQDVRVVSRPLQSAAELDMEGDLATEALSTAEDLCRAQEEDSEVAKRMSITGMGWSEIRVDYDRNIDGMIVRQRLPEVEMRWDSGAIMPNLEDRDWCARKRNVSRKKFTKRWGKDKLSMVDLNVPEMPYGQTEKYELVTPYYSMANEKANPQVGGDSQVKKDVEVIQYQWRDFEDIYRYQDDTTGQMATMDEDQWSTLEDRYKELGMEPPPAVRQQKPVFKQCYVARGVVLDDPIELPGFTFMCLTGQWDADKKHHYGIVRPMMDPQKTKNKAISSALGFHITNAKGGVMFKTRLFADPQNAKDQWSKYDAWIEVNDEADLGKDILPRKPTDMPPELPMFYSEAQKAIVRSAGISEEMVGTAVGQTPSQTAAGRTQAGVVVLGWYWDNLSRYRRDCAHIMLEMIRDYWTQGQLMQVGGDYNKQAIPLFKESLPDENQYSFVLDMSVRHNPNLRAQIWSDMLESGTLATLAKFGMGRVILQLLKYSPYPSQVVADIQREVAENPPQMPQKGGQKGPAAPPKKDDPNLVKAKVGLFGAQQQKAMAQARQIDKSTGLKMAEILQKSQDSAHKMQIHKDKHAQALQKQHQQWVQGMAAQQNQFAQQNAFAGAQGIDPNAGQDPSAGMEPGGQMQ